jgi:WD40 repeat protein
MKLELVAGLPVEGARALTFAPGSDRLIVTREKEGALVLDARTGKEIGKLPRGASVSCLDPEGTLAVVSEAGRARGGRHEWDVSLWDLAKVKRIAVIARNHPDEHVSPRDLGPTRLLCLRTKKETLSLCTFDHAGEPVGETPLGKVPHPFYAALTPDEQVAAHATFTGAAQFVDLRTGKGHKLVGGGLRVGRDPDMGISKLAIDSTGEYLMYASFATGCVHVWSMRTRKSLAGKWTKASVTDAFFFGGALGVAWSGSDGMKVTSFPLEGRAGPRVCQMSPEPALLAALGDGRHFACAGHSGYAAISAPSRGVAVWDLGSGKRAARAKEPSGMSAIVDLAACPDRVAVCDVKAGVALFAVA